MLFEHIARPEHCVRVSYEPGDVCVFDNHRLQHYAVSDYYPEARRIRRMSFASTHVVPARPWAKALGDAASRTDAGVNLAPPPAMDKEAAALAVDLAAGLRLLDRGGHSDLCAGFFSARHPSHPELFLTPSHGTHWSEVTPATFGVYSVATGERVAGEGPLASAPSAAVPAAIYRARPEVQSVVHAHPASVMSLAGLPTGQANGSANPILPVSEPSFMFYNRVGTLECDFFFDPEYLSKIAESFRDGEKFALLMANHSFLMTGTSVQETFIRSYVLDPSWYTFYTPFRAVYAPMYTHYTCIYIIYTPRIHTPNTPLNTL